MRDFGGTPKIPGLEQPRRQPGTTDLPREAVLDDYPAVRNLPELVAAEPDRLTDLRKIAGYP